MAALHRTLFDIGEHSNIVHMISGERRPAKHWRPFGEVWIHGSYMRFTHKIATTRPSVQENYSLAIVGQSCECARDAYDAKFHVYFMVAAGDEV